MSESATAQVFEHSQTPPASESAFADMLSHRYGDGTVYLRHNGLQALYRLAIRRGYVSEDGYLTRMGRHLLARCNYA